MSLTPRQFIERFEEAPTLPTRPDERFSGYGVMGLPFASGHVLAMRRFCDDLGRSRLYLHMAPLATLAIGAAYFEPFDPVRHSSRTFQSQALDGAAADRDPSLVRPGAPAGPREGLSPPRRT